MFRNTFFGFVQLNNGSFRCVLCGNALADGSVGKVGIAALLFDAERRGSEDIQEVKFVAQGGAVDKACALNAHGFATIDVGLFVVDEHTFLGSEIPAVEGATIDGGFGLQQVFFAGEHSVVQQPEQVAIVVHGFIHLARPVAQSVKAIAARA